MPAIAATAPTGAAMTPANTNVKAAIAATKAAHIAATTAAATDNIAIADAATAMSAISVAGATWLIGRVTVGRTTPTAITGRVTT